MKLARLSLLLLATVATALPAAAATLKIGLADDADVLDPDQARTFVGRIVFTALCDKLVDVTPELKIVPQLATKWSWSDDQKTLTMQLRKGVKFQDGTTFDAAAVKANIERSKTLKESRRKSELTSIDSVEVAGDHTVKFHLKQPDATLLAQFADRSGMMMSPTAFKKEGEKFSSDPVCSGPFQFVNRVQQDRIELKKFDGYWNADKIKVDAVTYLPIPDATVRLSNLRSGDLDIVDRVAPTDVKQVEQAPDIHIEKAVSLGYQGITINIDNTKRGDTPIGNEKLLRQALSLSIDRNALNQVVFNGVYKAGNQPFPPTSPWYDKSASMSGRDIDKAKALMKKAGQEKVSLTMNAPNSPQELQVAQVLQSMIKPAGFDLKIQPMEFASLLSADTAGNFELSQIGWSGRIDPDGNIDQFVRCGAGLNDSHYCNKKVDTLLQDARETQDNAERKQKYDAANEILMKDLPIIYLYHQTWLFGVRKDINGFKAYPDGMIRLEGVTKG
ncbi:ABC transporter substrate-binding protein [Pararhizobium mangrovi]|uniref:ABC transporter substrate-binding protein n=1 Tax=Pararhizobium mangrovi TaxID=2590452 RepID=A0A506U6H9_9HYPH|nr:ABC transporter substrate-binding protein [Pararhizobium mangrovi]TPW28674.1 ABC transporter substrate-binding protein [Pararhizobium mangrovi]